MSYSQKYKPTKSSYNKYKPNPQTSQSEKKIGMHPNNVHTGRYDLTALSTSLPELNDFIILNPRDEYTVDFTNPNAVKTLNKALLIHHYDLTYWDIPQGFLCPPIPSRADYIHNVADLLEPVNKKNKETSKSMTIHALDIGTGANCIYPIIGSHCYGWKFTATDIDIQAIDSAQLICDKNLRLKEKIQLQQQKNSKHIFKGIITENDSFDITVCNPPFHASLAEAEKSNQRKVKNLAYNKRKNNQTTQQPETKSKLNFGGQKSELWYEGGEIAFLKLMATESVEFARQVGWFTTLISKSENIEPLTKVLEELNAHCIKEIPMHHGQKTTRILAWSWQHKA